MPAITIWRDPKLVSDKCACEIRDAAGDAVAEAEKVAPATIEMRVRDFGPLDKNYPPIGIELDTGGGRDRWRIARRMDIAKAVAEHIYAAKVIPEEWLGPDKSYAWLKICESAFVPIGFPDHAR